MLRYILLINCVLKEKVCGQSIDISPPLCLGGGILICLMSFSRFLHSVGLNEFHICMHLHQLPFSSMRGFSFLNLEILMLIHLKGDK